MKKSFKLLVITSILVLAMAVSAFAANSTVSVSYTEAGTDGVHKITASVEDTLGVKLLGLLVSFDSDVVIPYDGGILGDVFDVTDTASYETTVLGTNAYQDANSLGVVLEAKLDNVPTIWEIDPATGRTAVKFTVQTTSGLKVSKTGAVFSFTFKLADNKTIDDAEFALEGVDTAFAYMTKAGFNAYGGVNTTDKSNVVSTLADSQITFDAFWLEEDDATLEIDVLAGDTVYEGTKVTEVTEAGKYTVTATEGYVVVNSGYTAQKVYEVKNGSVSEVTALANGVVAQDAVGIRSDSEETTGIRFKSHFTLAAKAQFVEAGVVVGVEKDRTYDKTTLVVGAANTKTGIAYNATTDIYLEADTTKQVVTAVTTGIPLNATNVKVNIAVRPYYKLANGTIVYGEIVRKTAYEAAYSIKNAADQSKYEANKEYVDEIIALGESSGQGDTIVDVGTIFGL